MSLSHYFLGQIVLSTIIVTGNPQRFDYSLLVFAMRLGRQREGLVIYISKSPKAKSLEQHKHFD